SGLGHFLIGLLLAVVALFLAETTLREIFIGMHRGAYVRDELVVSSMSSLDDEAQLHSQIASTGETVTVSPAAVAGPEFDRLRDMQREGQIKGHRIQVWRLPQETPWWWWGATEARVIDVRPSEDRFAVWRIAVPITGAFAAASVILIW